MTSTERPAGLGRQAAGRDPVPLDPPVRICVVCAGNICRSPMAEAVLRARLDAAGLGRDVVVDSAGTGAWHLGDGAHPRSVAALGRRGYRLDHRARQFEPAWFGHLDLVLALDGANLADLRALAPDDLDVAALRLLHESDVPDPWGQPDHAYEHALDLVERACDRLVPEIAAVVADRRADPAAARPGGTTRGHADGRSAG